MSGPPEKKKAPTLYVIIGIKLLKGAFFLSLAIVIYCLSDNDLPEEFRRLLTFFHWNPERRFFVDLADKIGSLTEANLRWAAAGTFAYSLFSLVEGIGLAFRVPWAGWMTIGESAFFIPIEVWELINNASIKLVVVLALNIFIVWYLFQNRGRLFKHHH